ncbi:MAG: T9SS type A sorting domain-containing protein, partial [Bacteroidota bacterium]|nr:T9SS type A sorting domain-containing protein [Bacteroidota bacterium]
CPGIADSNRVINYTTLYNYRIINRSQRSYNGVYVGLWNSCSLGDITDDYMGSDSVLASAFIYNGDNNDQSYPMQVNYGLNPPMQNLVFLRGMEADAGDGIDNNLNGIVDEPGEHTTMNHFISADGPNNSPIGNPQSGADHYNYMQSKWLDGLQLTAGSNGRDPSNPPTNFMFSGTPYTLKWNEQTSGNAPFERVFVASSGPVSLPSSGEINIDFAYVFTWDSTAANGLTTSIARNVADVQRVKNWFDNNSFPACINYYVGLTETDLSSKLSVYPNPAQELLFIKNESSQTSLNYEISDVSGRIVLSGRYDREKGITIRSLQDGYYGVRVHSNTTIKAAQFIKISSL